MPHIIVTAGATGDVEAGTVMLRERVSAADFESDRFATNLLERLGWAVGDATEVERREPTEERDETPERDYTSNPELVTA
jgi:hypothetical protein